MVAYEGNFKTGWLVTFTTEETRRIAQPVGAYATPLGTIASVIPEPAVTRAISISSSLIGWFAKRAVHKNTALAVYVRGMRLMSPTFPVGYRRLLSLSELARLRAGRSLPATPFFYRESDPRSLGQWRNALGISAAQHSPTVV